MESEATPIKQSMAVALTFGFNALVLIIPLVMYLFVEPYLGGITTLLIIMALYVIEAILIYLILNKKGTKLFKKLYR